MSGIDFSEVKILCSPLLRCLQTASKVSCEFQKLPIRVNYILSEDFGAMDADCNDPID